MVSTFLKLASTFARVPGWPFAVVDAADRQFSASLNVSLEIPQIGVAVAIFFTAILLAATSSISPAAPPTTFEGGKPVH